MEEKKEETKAGCLYFEAQKIRMLRSHKVLQRYFLEDFSKMQVTKDF